MSCFKSWTAPVAQAQIQKKSPYFCNLSTFRDIGGVMNFLDGGEFNGIRFFLPCETYRYHVFESIFMELELDNKKINNFQNND